MLNCVAVKPSYRINEEGVDRRIRNIRTEGDFSANFEKTSIDKDLGRPHPGVVFGVTQRSHGPSGWKPNL